MRVAINGFFWGREDTGSGQYLHHLAQALLAQEADNRYFLIRPRISPETQPHWPNSLFTAPPPLGENLGKLWFEQISFPKAASQNKVDVAHVPYFAAPLFSPLPTVITIHDLIPFILPAYSQGVRQGLYNRLIVLAAKRAAAIVVDSQATKRDVINILKIPEGRIPVVYLAAGDDYRPAAKTEIDALRKKHDLPDRYLLYLGGFDRRKNLGVLFQAMAGLGDSAPHMPLVVAGQIPKVDSTFFQSPQRLADEAGVENRVRFIGWVAEAEKPALYSGADIFLYPSLYEGFGLPPLEAMACGTPVIASRSSSLIEVVGEGGILADPKNPQEWAEAIFRLLADEQARHELMVKGQKQAGQFSWQKTARETLTVYHGVAK